jgi:hypothetical protein
VPSTSVPALSKFPLSHEQLALLGEIVAFGGLVEAVADSIVCGLVTGDREDVEPLVAGQPISWFLDRIDELADRRPSEADELHGWVTQARAAFVQRNLLVHSSWFMELPEYPGTAVGRRRRRGKDVEFHFRSALDMAAVRDQYMEVYNAGLAHARQINELDRG